MVRESIRLTRKQRSALTQMRLYQKDSGACLKVGPMDKLGATWTLKRIITVVSYNTLK